MAGMMCHLLPLSLLCLSLTPITVQLQNPGPSCDINDKDDIRCASCDQKQHYPRKHDRIAIVGAGPAGIHMTYLLQNLGYKDITVFEKTDRVGGKSYTYDHKGTKHDMGTVFTTPEYTEFYRLLKEFPSSKSVPAVGPSYWVEKTSYFDIEFPLHAIAVEYGINDPNIAQEMLEKATKKYIALHKELFSEYEGELFPRPDQDVLERTRGTFMEYLDRNNITVLKYIFVGSHTRQGYGVLNVISALYGLMWNTPALIMAIVDSTHQSLRILDGGFEDVWKTIVDERRIKVIFNTDIVSIQRNKQVSIRYYQRVDACSSNEAKTGIFDFLILTPNMKEMFGETVKDPSVEELRIFSKPIHTYFTTTLVDSDFGLRGKSPINYFLFDTESQIDHIVEATGDKYAILHGFVGGKYEKGQFPGNSLNENIETAVYYQLGRNKPSKKILDDMLASHAAAFRKGDYEVIKRITWNYFPRYSPEDMTSGILWDILDMQGYENTWYIGSSVCFESVKSVLEYNKLLLRKFKLI